MDGGSFNGGSVISGGDADMDVDMEIDDVDGSNPHDVAQDDNETIERNDGETDNESSNESNSSQSDDSEEEDGIHEYTLPAYLNPDLVNDHPHEHSPQPQLSTLQPLDSNMHNPLPVYFDCNMDDYRIDEPHVKASVDLYRYFVEHGAPRALYESVIERVNTYIGDRATHLCSHYLAGKHLERSYPILPNTYDMCVKGCYMFSSDDDHGRDRCPYCRTERLNPKGAPLRTIKQLSLSAQLALLVRNKTTREQLKYPLTHEKPEDDDSERMDDVFDSQLFQKV